MKTNRLAKLFEAKYGFTSEGADPPKKAPRDRKEEARLKKEKSISGVKPSALTVKTPKPAQQVVNELKQKIKDFKLIYIDKPTEKEGAFAYNAIPLLANAGDPFMNELIKEIDILIISMDDIQWETILKRMNDILVRITEEKYNGKTGWGNIVDTLFKMYPSSEDKRFARAKRGVAEVVGKRLAGLLSDSVRILNKILELNAPIEGGRTEPEAIPLTRKQIQDFMLKYPAAQKYHLDSDKVMERFLPFPELRKMLTKLVNSVTRGHATSRVGADVMKETDEIMEALRHAETNELALQQHRLPNVQIERELLRQQRKPEVFEGPDPEFVAQRNKEEAERARMHAINLQFQQEEEARAAAEKAKAEEIKADRERLLGPSEASAINTLINKYNSLSFSDWLKRSSR